MYTGSRLLVFVMLSVLPVMLYSVQCPLAPTWNKSFVSSEDQNAHAVVSTPDESFFVLGSTGVLANGEGDVVLWKIDDQGNFLWQRLFGGSGQDLGFDLRQTSDHNLLLFGKTDSWSEGDDDLYLIKVTPDGNLLWAQTYGGGRDEIGFGVRETSDGNLILVGSSESYGDGSSDVLLLSTTPDGSELWSHTYGWYGTEVGYGVAVADDGNLFVTGSTDSLDTQTQLFVLKTDAQGGEQWIFTYPETECVVGKDIITVKEGGVLIAGGAYESMSDTYDLCLVRIDEYGNLLWYRSVDFEGGDEIGYAVKQMRSEYVSIGYSASRGSQRMFVVKVDVNGHDVWKRVYPASYAYGVGYDLIPVRHQGLVLVGSMTGSGGDRDMWLVRTDQDGSAPLNTDDEVVSE